MTLINYTYENEPNRTVREDDIVYYDVSKFINQPAELCYKEGKTPYWILDDGRRISGYAELVTIDGQLHLLDMLMYHYCAFETRDSLIVGDDVRECVLGNLEYLANTREYSCVKDLELDSYRNHECPVEYNVSDCINIPTIGEFMSTEDRWVRNDAQPMYESTKTQYMANAASDAEIVNRNITSLLRNVAEFSDIKDVATKQELIRLEKIRDLVIKIGARSRSLRDKTERDIYFKVHGN